MFSTIEWTDEGVILLDQRRLPEQEIYLTLRSAEEVAEAIRDMAIRGAPAIGVAAAMGIALGFRSADDDSPGTRRPRFESLARLLTSTRPTAVNLSWAVERMRRRFEEHASDPFPRLASALKEEALLVRHEDIEANRAMGRHGAELLPDDCRVGADRIARNGDTANKIGTYQVAVLAQAHGVPFYVAAPTSTIDLAAVTGAEIPIEERSPLEVAHIGGRRVVPEGVPVIHPAFDVTPHRLIAAIVTERGVVLRSEEHTSELQSRLHLVCRLLLEKKKKKDE